MNTRAGKTTRKDRAPTAPMPTNTISAAREPDSVVRATAIFVTPERRRALIAEAAYYRAERRGFESGHELDDWCGAESEIDGMLARGEIARA